MDASPVTRTFSAPRSFHPSSSLLGRAVRAWTGDRLRGEALFLVLITGLGLALLMTHFLGWALLKPVLSESPRWQMLFWGGQVVSVLALAGIGLVGFRPPVRVRCTPDALALTQGDQSCTLFYASISEVDTVSAQQYHRHYRRHAAARIFVSRLPDEVILLRTPEEPVLVGLPDAEAQAALLDLLRSECPSPSESAAQGE